MTDKKSNLYVPSQEGQLSMMLTRGGPRDGAGRKGIGETRKVSLTLTKEAWLAIEDRCNNDNCSRSEVLRDIIESHLTKL